MKKDYINIDNTNLKDFFNLDTAIKVPNLQHFSILMMELYIRDYVISDPKHLEYLYIQSKQNMGYIEWLEKDLWNCLIDSKEKNDIAILFQNEGLYWQLTPKFKLFKGNNAENLLYDKWEGNSNQLNEKLDEFYRLKFYDQRAGDIRQLFYYDQVLNRYILNEKVSKRDALYVAVIYSIQFAIYAISDYYDWSISTVGECQKMIDAFEEIRAKEFPIQDEINEAAFNQKCLFSDLQEDEDKIKQGVECLKNNEINKAFELLHQVESLDEYDERKLNKFYIKQDIRNILNHSDKYDPSFIQAAKGLYSNIQNKENEIYYYNQDENTFIVTNIDNIIKVINEFDTITINSDSTMN